MPRARRHAIPEDVKKQAEAIVDAFNTRVIRDPNRYYRPRYRGRFLYLDRVDYGIQKFVCRLTFTGRTDNWEFAIYKYSERGTTPMNGCFRVLATSMAPSKGP